MSASVELPLSEGNTGSQQQMAMRDSCKEMPPPPPITNESSPVSIMTFSRTTTAAVQKQDKLAAQATSANPETRIIDVIKRLQTPPLPPKKRKTRHPSDNASAELSPIPISKPRKRKLFDAQPNKTVKKRQATLPPPTLATCNRHVLGSDLRLPRVFTSGSRKSALKYARMPFPFSDRHNCALVPTAIFLYGRSSQVSNAQSEDTKSKYSFRRRVWLMVPHRLAPAHMVIRKVQGPPEPVSARS